MGSAPPVLWRYFDHLACFRAGSSTRAHACTTPTTDHQSTFWLVQHLTIRFTFSKAVCLDLQSSVGN